MLLYFQGLHLHHSSQLGQFRTYIKPRLYYGSRHKNYFVYCWNNLIHLQSVTDNQCTVTKVPSTNVFNELCVKISLLRSIPKKLKQYVMRSTSDYASISCIFFHQLQPRDTMAPITRGLPNASTLRNAIKILRRPDCTLYLCDISF